MNFFTLQLTEISFSEAVLIALLGFLLVMVVLAVLAVFVKLLSKATGSVFGNKESEVKREAPKPKISVPAPAPKAPAPAAVTEFPGFSQPGYVYLENISEKDAAVVMAITSEKTGIPLERLSFNSIKRLDKTELTGISDREAACIMAITADRLKKPLSCLDFKSIKPSEE